MATEQQTCDRRRRRAGRPVVCGETCRGRHRRRRPVQHGAGESGRTASCAQGGINACNDIARQQGYSGGCTSMRPRSAATSSPTSRWSSRVQLGAEDHRPARPHGRALQPHARRPARPASLRRLALQAHVSSPALTTGQQLLYALDEQTRRHEAAGRIRQFGVPGNSLLPVVHDGPKGEKQCVGIVAQDMRTMEIKAYRGDAVVVAHRRQRADLRQEHHVGHLHRRRRQPLLSGRRAHRQPGDDPGPPDRHPRRRQMSIDQRKRPRRRRPRMGAQD